MLIQHTDIPQFCEAVWPWLLQAEADYCVLVGLVQRMRGRGYVAMSVDELPEPMLWTVQSGEQLELVAIQTLKTMMSVSRGSQSAMRLLAEELAARGWQGKAISGICPSISQLAEQYERLSRRSRRLRVRMRNFQVSSVTMPPAASGKLHRATADDRLVVGQFLKEFDEWLGEPIEEDYQARADRIIGEGRAYLWLDGEPVSMALWTGRTPSGVRISCVYTPAKFRRRGYASNLVAYLSQQLLDEGSSFCFLNADLSNPISNSIYQKIGYRPTCDSQIWEFGPIPAGATGDKVLGYATSVQRVRKRNMRFGMISILCTGLALRVLFSSDYWETTKFKLLFAPVIVILFASGGVSGVIGLRRGAASIILSLISLAVIALFSLIFSLVFLTTRFPS